MRRCFQGSERRVGGVLKVMKGLDSDCPLSDDDRACF